MKSDNLRERVGVLVGSIVLSAFLLLLDSVGTTTFLYNVASYLTEPMKAKVHSFAVNTNDVLGVLGKVTRFREENEKLRDENLRLIEQVSELEEYKTESEVLKEQINLMEPKRNWVLEARVIGSDISLENSLQLNVGSEDGVEDGDIVIFGKFAVGEVDRVEKYSSKVLLITSPSSNVPVRGQKNRAIGLVRGEVGLTLKMIDILIDEKLEEGEFVVTSGVDSQFPAGFIVGVVSSVNDNPAYATQEALINVQIDFSRLDYVYIIKGQDI